MASATPPTNSFGDALLCPVCFIMFEGRIHQCSQGHSVCEKCYRQLGTATAQCPQCRSIFVGTRNYILEDLVKQLKIIKQMTCANATTSDAENGNAEAKINQAMEQIFNSIPIPNDNESAEAPVPNFTLPPSGASGELPGEAAALPIVATPPPNHQPPGLFSCRMVSCDTKLPSCRLLNHIRSFHVADLMETHLPTNEEFITHLSFPTSSYRRAIQIKKFGLFFFIVNYKKESQKTIVTAWVQRVCPNKDARKYTFQLEMRLGNHIGAYTDYVYGDSSGAAYIEEKQQCLVMELSRRAKKSPQIAVDIKILKTERPTNLRRTNTTTITLLQNQLAQH